LAFTRPFDEYGSVCWEDEKARLDNFAVQLQNVDRSTSAISSFMMENVLAATKPWHEPCAPRSISLSTEKLRETELSGVGVGTRMT
jgi:hypothetical protein